MEALIKRSLNGRERGQNFDNARHRAQNGEHTGVVLSVHRWSRRCYSIGVTVASIGPSKTTPYQRSTKVHHRNVLLLQRPTPFQQFRVRS